MPAAPIRNSVRLESPDARLAPVFATVNILETDDVVFAEIAAGLDLDQNEIEGSGVLEPVGDTNRDVGRLVLGEDRFLLALGHSGGALDDDPVLGAVVVHLKRKLLPRGHDDLLDLKAVPLRDTFVGSPRSVDLCVEV